MISTATAAYTPLLTLPPMTVQPSNVSNEIDMAVKAFDMDLKQLRNTIIYGFKRSFFPGAYTERRTYVRQIIDYYDKLIEHFEKEGEVLPSSVATE